MQLLDLAGDVLADVLRNCTISSRLALSRTSSQANVLAIPYLLRDVQITGNPTHIFSFLRYIIDHTQLHSENSDTAQVVGAGIHVKTLDITYLAFFVEGQRNAPPPTWAGRLSRALALMPNLQTIVLAHQVDDIAANSADFAGTLMSRPHLRNVRLFSVDIFAAEQLWEALKARQNAMNLKKMTMDLKRQDDITSIARGVGNILFYSRSSLTELCLANIVLHGFLCGENQSEEHVSDGIGPVPSPLVFPRVVTLSLTSCNATSAALAHSFPNVRTLTLFTSHLTDASCPRTCPAVRAAHPALFPELSSLEGDESDVTRFLQSDGQYQSCRRIVIDSQWDYPGKHVGDMGPNFSVADAVPRLESFHFHLWHVSPTELWWREFVESVPHLTFLKVSVRVRTAKEFDLSCARLPAILSPLALEYVSLRLYRSEGSEGSNGSDVLMGSDADAETESVHTDEAVALEYARNLPTLEYFDIEGNQCVIHTRFWRVIREREEYPAVLVRVRELDEEDGLNAKNWFDWKL